MSRLLLSNGKPIEIPLDNGVDMEDYGADDEADHKLEVDIEDAIKNERKRPKADT